MINMIRYVNKKRALRVGVLWSDMVQSWPASKAGGEAKGKPSFELMFTYGYWFMCMLYWINGFLCHVLCHVCRCIPAWRQDDFIAIHTSIGSWKTQHLKHKVTCNPTSGIDICLLLNILFSQAPELFVRLGISNCEARLINCNLLSTNNLDAACSAVSIQNTWWIMRVY